MIGQYIFVSQARLTGGHRGGTSSGSSAQVHPRANKVVVRHTELIKAIRVVPWERARVNRHGGQSGCRDGSAEAIFFFCRPEETQKSDR